MAWSATVDAVTAALPPQRADAARNRTRLLEVAAAHRRTHGRPPALKQLAGEAGVGVGTVYRHFPTTEELLGALAAESMDRLIVACRAAAADADVAAGFEELVGAVLRGQLADEGVGVVLRAPDDPCATPSSQAVELGAAVADVLMRARRAGVVRMDIEADDIRRYLLGFASALQPVADDDAVVARGLRVLLDGLRSPTASSPNSDD